MRHYTQILTGSQTAPTPDAWLTWFNCDDDEQTIMLAAHRYIRERGGFGEDEAKIIFTVAHYTDDTPTHPNGRPRSVKLTTFDARRNT